MNKILFSGPTIKEILVDNKDGVFSLNGKHKAVHLIRINPNLFHCILEDKNYMIEVLDQENGESSLRINGKRVKANLLTPLDQLLGSMGMNKKSSTEVREIKAPMPGLILEIFVKPGSKIVKGDPILILEAMKMENVIKSPIDGEIKSIKVKAGESVAKNQLLIEF